MESDCTPNTAIGEVLLLGQQQVLELIAAGQPLHVALNTLCRCIESAAPDARCSILLLDRDGQHVRHIAAPTLPQAYCALIDGQPIGPRAGSCGTAAFFGKRVVVEAIAIDPLWQVYKEIALSFGLAACASVPIYSTPGSDVLGTFAIYHYEAGPFSERELLLLESMCSIAAVAILNDRREQVLQQMQRQESLVVLAGGVAHDFNNLLTIISGNTGLIRTRFGNDAILAPLIHDIETATKQATELTHQLLAFAGKANFAVKQLQLNEVLLGIERLLSVTVSKWIGLDFEFAPELPFIVADATQLQQVALNLIANASEAIGDREGRIRVVTRIVNLDEYAIRRRLSGQHLESGDYVALDVIDNGSGMPANIVTRIFEPFFTTKLSGRGLGLAAVFGIVRAHRGGIELETRTDIGTRFTCYFPVSSPTEAVLTSDNALRMHQTNNFINP